MKKILDNSILLTKFILLVLLMILIVFTMTSCAWLGSEVHSLKGSLIGVSYTAEIYDNFGNMNFVTRGENIDITGNRIEEIRYSSDGTSEVGYDLSSVLTITIDGKEIESCGDSIIFAESGLEKDVDFTITDIESINNGGLENLTLVAKQINKYKNIFGKSRVVIIKSQKGIPICAYSGEEVYWEIPGDLPKVTKIMIDGKALYIHRVNFQIIDKALIE